MRKASMSNALEAAPADDDDDDNNDDATVQGLIVR
jgi:hypothetical protein